MLNYRSLCIIAKRSGFGWEKGEARSWKRKHTFSMCVPRKSSLCLFSAKRALCRGFYRKKKIQAFSLIEMSLVLAIMGTIAGLSLPLLLKYNNAQKRQHSKDTIELVLSATGTFAATHHRLPCPASKTSKGEPIICNSITLATGYVPYKILGLSEATSKDGFGHPLRYALDPQLSSHKDFYKNIDVNHLKITDQNDKSVLGVQNKNDKIALVILSEGEAFKSPQGPFELTNMAENLRFVDAPYRANKEAPFRHIMRWSTRNNLLTYYGKSSPLPKAQDTPEHQTGGRAQPPVPPPQQPPQGRDRHNAL